MKGSSRTVVLVTLAAVVLLGSLVLAVWPTAKRGAFSGVLSTHRADSLGGKALFEVLARAGHRPRRHTDSLAALPAAGVVFVLHPEAPKPAIEGLPRGPTFSRAERRSVASFVLAGGRVVLVSNRTTALHRDFGVTITDPPRTALARAHAPGLVSLVATSRARGTAKRLEARRVHHLDIPIADPRAVFTDASGVVVASVERGRGEVVFVAAPSLAGNALLSAADNLAFWADLAVPRAGARGAELRFDEYHHGHRTPRGLVALALATDLHFVLWQLALAGALLLWAGLRRLPSGDPVAGSPRDSPGDRRGAEESIAATASLYERGRLGRHAADQIGEWLERTLAARLHLRAERGHDLAVLLRRRGCPELARDLESLRTQRGALPERPRARDLLAFARAVSALRHAADDAFSARRHGRADRAHQTGARP